ncbi:MAG: hypothetical protein H6728_17805 [Myxococcales bacterium]|nr:hypothetical protein [Myxococcales bacterium]
MVSLRWFAALCFLLFLSGCQDVPKKLFFEGEEYNHVHSRRIGNSYNHIYVPHGQVLESAVKAVHITKHVKTFTKAQERVVKGLFSRIKNINRGVSFKKREDAFCSQRKVREGDYIFFHRIYLHKGRLTEVNYRRATSKEERDGGIPELCAQSESIFGALSALAKKVNR